MEIGFTGTQRGMTAAQRGALAGMLKWALRREAIVFRHGDCIGADEEGHDIAEGLGAEIIIHPPTDARKRAWRSAGHIMSPQPYLIRNRAIVAASGRLIAAPGERIEQLRSGTWATVRYARQLGRKVTILLPGGGWVQERSAISEPWLNP